MKKPLLSIGIIFKNEFRCIERCLKSLQPLRDALPCEVVMADTGADDGSRAVAEQYADILFDFPWINDFAAARNAVMDRCSGEWYMTIDCDEWVDADIQGFVRFLGVDRDFDFASVIIRNYNTQELEAGGGYADFLGVRLLRLSTGIRYEGTIHEHWPYGGDLRTMLIRGGLFHHDGYVYQDPAKQKEKQKRNMALLREQLERDPDNLIVLTQCIESGDNLPEQGDYLRRAMAGVEEKWSQWELFGPPIYRYAVRYAIAKQLPELEEWIGKAQTMFPDSIFTRVEIAYFAFGNAWRKDDYAKSIYWGEKYLQGVEDYETGHFNRGDLLASSLNKTDTHSKLNVATVLASGYLHEGQPEKCAALLGDLNPAEMNVKQIGDFMNSLFRLRGEFGWDTDPLVLRAWELLDEPSQDKEKQKSRKSTFIQVGSAVFTQAHRDAEQGDPKFRAHGYTIFLPLAGRCGLGNAAAVLEASGPEELEEKLRAVEHWDETPIQALSCALEGGVPFPLVDRPLNIEEMDTLAARLAQVGDGVIPLALSAAEQAGREGWQGACWTRGLLLAAVHTCPWSGKEQSMEQSMELARAFARMEREFLPRCYAAEVLREDTLFTLPSLHRFGWYCAQAFDALDAGDGAGYVRLLREGLNACEGAKDMVEFLIDHTPGLKDPSEDLKELAEQIRAVLARFSPGDPAVAALKQSEAYRKVAYLIEGTAPPIVGGLSQ